jgi:hypothetical protein
LLAALRRSPGDDAFPGGLRERPRARPYGLARLGSNPGRPRHRANSAKLAGNHERPKAWNEGTMESRGLAADRSAGTIPQDGVGQVLNKHWTTRRVVPIPEATSE